MFGLKQLFICLSILLAITNLASAEDATTNRINGVAEFLLERANDNYLYILQQDMEANKLLKCYLPQTYKYATSSNLQLLLQSGPDLWKGSVETDLKNFGIQLIFKQISPDALKKWARTIDDKYIETLQNIQIKIEGNYYGVTSIPLNASPNLKTAVNNFYDDYLKARTSIDSIISDIEKNKNSFSTECPTSSYFPIRSVLLHVQEAIDNFKAQISHIENADVVWKGNGTSQVSPGSEFYTSLTSLLYVNERVKYYSDQISAIQNEKSLVVQMFKLDQLIRDSVKSGDNPIISSSELKEYDHFSRYALSFAALSEAQSTDQVKSVMNQLALPPVSFGIKREPNARKFMITAYFGVEGGVESASNDKYNGYMGLTVPVGFEYTYGLNNGVVSVMLAPIDFAHPVNQIINNKDSSAHFEDIFSPGIYISYGVKKLPLVLGIGASRGQSITDSQRTNDFRSFLFIGLDMPLFNFY